MKAIQKKAMAAAVVAAFGVGSAEAVFQNPDGTGQVLIYPYYTVQQVGGKSMNTLVSVVNTTSTGKVVKVRFREGRASKEVLDFNLYLSPNDVWTAAVVPASASDATSPGRLLSFDKSCTNPAIPAGGVDFRNFAYAGDGLGNGLDRTREGYMEIIELATLGNPVLNAITHNALGVPNNCAFVRTANGALPDPTNSSRAPTGGLTGTGTLVNVAQGSDIGYNAVALADWSPEAQVPSLGTETNTLADGFPISVVTTTSDILGRQAQLPWVTYNIWQNRTGTTALGFDANAINAVDAVSSTMMASSVINEFILEDTTASNTDWVLTFPTRWFYHGFGARNATQSNQTIYPFTETLRTFGLCQPVGIDYFDREEKGATVVGDFSPSPEAETSVCNEVTVVSFRGRPHNPSGDVSGVLGSKNITPIEVGGFSNGWARLTFLEGTLGTPRLPATASEVTTFNTNDGFVTGLSPATFAGLPVVGFMARSFTNNSAGTCDVVPCNYNASFGHKFVRSVKVSGIVD